MGSRENGYSVQKGLPSGTQGNFFWPYGITIVTPDREYLFTCETEADQLDWVTAFTSIIDQAMTPQEYASKCPNDVSSPLAALPQCIALMHCLFSSLQLKPTSSLNHRKPGRNLAVTQLYLVLLGGLSKEERRLMSEKHSALAAYSLKHFFFFPLQEQSSLFWGSFKLLQVQDFVRLNPQCKLSVVNCCDLTGC